MTYTGWGSWPTWLDDATEPPACRGFDTDLFFPEATRDGGNPNVQVRAAKAICGQCPLLEPCREWAVEQGPYLAGVWGGTTFSERRRRPRPGAQPAQFRKTTTTSTTTRSA